MIGNLRNCKMQVENNNDENSNDAYYTYLFLENISKNSEDRVLSKIYQEKIFVNSISFL